MLDVFEVIKTNRNTGRFTRSIVSQTINCDTIEDLEFINDAITHYNKSLPEDKQRWLSKDRHGDIALTKY